MPAIESVKTMTSAVLSLACLIRSPVLYSTLVVYLTRVGDHSSKQTKIAADRRQRLRAGLSVGGAGRVFPGGGLCFGGRKIVGVCGGGAAVAGGGAAFPRDAG
jgi:hypothetical protein